MATLNVTPEVMWSSITCGGCMLSEAQKKLKFKRCGACHTVWYCGIECQRKEWSSHKPQCKQATEHKTAVPDVPPVTCSNQADACSVPYAPHKQDRPYNFVTGSRLHDGGDEVEGDDDSDDEDAYDGYQPLSTPDATMDGLSQLIRHMQLSGSARSEGGMTGPSPWLNMTTQGDEEDRQLQMAIQASIKEEEERVKKERQEEEKKKKDEEIKRAQDEIQQFYERSLAKSREGIRVSSERLADETQDEGEPQPECAYDEDDLLYSDNDEADFSDYDEVDDEEYDSDADV